MEGLSQSILLRGRSPSRLPGTFYYWEVLWRVTIAAELGQVSRFDSARQLCPAKTPVADEPDVAAPPRPATRTCDESSSKPHGAIVVHPVSGTDCGGDRRTFPKRRKR